MENYDLLMYLNFLNDEMEYLETRAIALSFIEEFRGLKDGKNSEVFLNTEGDYLPIEGNIKDLTWAYNHLISGHAEWGEKPQKKE